jgi:hypothetical protein
MASTLLNVAVSGARDVQYLQTPYGDRRKSATRCRETPNRAPMRSIERPSSCNARASARCSFPAASTRSFKLARARSTMSGRCSSGTMVEYGSWFARRERMCWARSTIRSRVSPIVVSTVMSSSSARRTASSWDSTGAIGALVSVSGDNVVLN